MFDIDWRGLILPVSYLLVLGGTFITFSRVYRKRKAVQSANLSPWFPPHLQRDIYLSLLHMEPTDEDKDGKKEAKVPDAALRAALLRRAVEDIRRIIQIRTGKQACAALLQRGSVGDDLWQRFLRAEREMEEELRDVVMEANALVPNWGQIIFQTANAIAANTQLREKLQAIQDKAGPEKAAWLKRRTAMQRQLLEEEGIEPDKGNSTGTAETKGVPETKDSEDAVLVEASNKNVTRPSTANTNTPNTPNTPSGSKKKKGKK